MTYAEICGAVETLDKKYDERDPFRLCRAMGIKLILQPMGKDPDAVKGFFLESKRIRTITVNSDLPEIIQRIIVAHEICHAMFHRKSGIHAFHEVALFEQNSVLEKEANLFAAEFLLSDESVLMHMMQTIRRWNMAKRKEPKGMTLIEFNHSGIPDDALKPEEFSDYQLVILKALPPERQEPIHRGCPVSVVDLATGNRIATFNMHNIVPSEFEMKLLAESVYKATERYFQDPEHVKEYEAWKKKREDESNERKKN